MKTVKFHKTRWNCTQTVNFIQKISELTKMTIIIVCNSHQFLSTIKNASAYVCGPVVWIKSQTICTFSKNWNEK